jgi:hypothetical protein
MGVLPAMSRFKTPRLRMIVRIVVLVALVVFVASSPKVKAAKLIFPTFFGLERLRPGLYVDRALTPPEREKIIKVVDEAQARLEHYYGNRQSSPALYFCGSAERFRALGGVTERGFTFLRHACVFSPAGSTPSIVAHEWSHAELSTRVGLWRIRHVPQWFDEGVAVTVSEEPSHAEAVYQEALRTRTPVPALADLKTLRQWNATAKRYGDRKLNPHRLHVVYATAGHEVRNWYAQAGSRGLVELLEHVRAGQEFAASYAQSTRDPANRRK